MKSRRLLFAGVASATVAASEPLTTIDPCPGVAHLPPVTVTSQYQQVPTCSPTTACENGKCSVGYQYTTVPWVSTVVPHAWNGETSQSTTITEANQLYIVSEHEEIRTVTVPSERTKHKRGKRYKRQPDSKSATIVETVTRRAVAPYTEVGPLAVPGWEGSGICKLCADEEDEQVQPLDVIECRQGTDQGGKPYQSCSGWHEVWREPASPTSTVEDVAFCSSRGSIPSAGVYTWTFPQQAPATEVTPTPRMRPLALSNQERYSVDPKQVYTAHGRPWSAYVTRSFDGPTTFDFNEYITERIAVTAPHETYFAESTRQVAVPTGSVEKQDTRGWPLQERDENGSRYFGGDWDGSDPSSPVMNQLPVDWSSSTTSTTSTTSSQTLSSTASVGPIDISTTGQQSSSTLSSSSTLTDDPITNSVSTTTRDVSTITSTTSLSESQSTLSTSSDISSSVVTDGPINLSTTTTITTTTTTATTSSTTETTTTTASTTTTDSTTTTAITTTTDSTTATETTTTTVTSTASVNPIGFTTSTSTITTITTTTTTTTTASSTTTTSGPFPWTYQGCYVDAEPRLLQDIQVVRYPRLTLQWCAALCTGYQYFGVQFSQACYCDNAFRLTLVSAPDRECNMQCIGDTSQRCGGRWRMDIYRAN